MTDKLSFRKTEQIRIIGEDAEVDRGKSYFDEIHLRHRALPELDLAAVDPGIEFLGKRLSFPLLISGMTGGDDDLLRTINRNLAIAAQATGVAMGVGSQRVMFTNPAARPGFALREYAPDCLLFANLGAVQLNCGFGLGECREAVAILEADALCLHLNPLQEAVQPEGDSNFAGLADKAGEVAAGLEVPVILKEVGAGISPADVELALARGIRYIDVAGTGGTSWSRIEQQRNSAGAGSDEIGFTFQDWGIPTPRALELLAPWRDKITVIASGGVRSGIDLAKAVILGARLCGVAEPFLAPAGESAQAVIRVIERFKREYVTAMFLLGAASFEQLHFNQALVL